MAKLVLCMALKNEAATVARAIRSIAPICDRAVISIDSKDTQGTEQVARQACVDMHLPADFVEHVWQDSFSLMRNNVMKYAENGPGDWLIWVDGHEFLYESHKHILKSLLEGAPADIWLYSLMIKMMDHSGAWRDSFLQSKCWRMDKGIEYGKRAMHNQISMDSCPMERRMGVDNIWIGHERTEANANERADQRNELLPKLLQPEADEMDEDAKFHMCAHWYTQRDHDKFFEVFNSIDFDETKINADCQYQTRLYASMLHAAAEEWDESDQQLLKCEHLTDNRSDHIQQKGRNCIARGEYDKACKFFELCTLYPLPTTHSFAHVAAYTWEPYANMACAMETKGDLLKAWVLYHVAMRKGAGPQHVGLNIRAIEKQMGEKVDNWPDKDGKPRLLILDNLDQFSMDLARELSGIYNVAKLKEPDPGFIELADVIWCDWLNDNAKFMSELYRKEKIVFARLHGYEAIEQDYPAQINTSNLDFIIGVSQQMIDYMNRRFTPPFCPVVKINNGLDTERFKFKKRCHGLDIAYVSLLNNKKNISFICQIANRFRQHRIHICGRWQDARLEEYFNHQRDSQELDNLIYAGWHENINGFLEDKNYLLTTSLWESFSFATHEAMAKGIKPLVHNWVGCDEFIPVQLTWFSLDDLDKLLSPESIYDSGWFRRMAENYSLRTIADQIHDEIRKAQKRKAKKHEPSNDRTEAEAERIEA